MVAISRALMFNAKLIIMDEPTTALTKKEVDALFKIILNLKAQGIAILFISHKLNEVFEISERFTILRNGEMVATGNTKDLDDSKFTYYMTGREFENKKFLPAKVSEKPIFELDDLTSPGSFEHVNIKLHGGEILGITGLLDSGRTELALAMFGMLPASSGKIIRNGKVVEIKNARDAIANKIGYVPEDRLSEGLFLQRSIADNIIISEIDHLTSKGIYDRKKRDREVGNWVHEMEVKTDNPENPVTTLSGGNQQKVVLAKWLATKPEVLILNGPTVGVDIGSKHDIHVILQKLAEDGMGVIIISDDLPEIVQNCSRVDVIKEGRIVGEFSGEGLNEAAILSAMM